MKIVQHMEYTRTDVAQLSIPPLRGIKYPAAPPQRLRSAELQVSVAGSKQDDQRTIPKPTCWT